MQIATVECPKCHTEILEGAHFCVKCGGRVDESDARAAAPPELPAAPPSKRPVVPSSIEASLLEIDADFGAIAPIPPTTTAPAPAASKAPARNDDVPPRRQPSMAEQSRDEVLRRARMKQSLKRAGLAGMDLSGASLEGVDLARADLEGANLENAKLRGANLKSANLRGARLKGADFSQADLDKADLEGAQAEGAVFEGANLKRASLEGAQLKGARFDGANLAGAELVATDLTGARFVRADLSHAELTEADLAAADATGATLTSANLQGSTLDGANLTDAVLCDADLRGASALAANFERARLERACLDGVVLTHAMFAHADLRRASFEGAKLEGAVLQGAKVGGAQLVMGARGAVADWLDASPLGDGSVRLEGARAQAFLAGEPVRAEQGTTRYFGHGDVLRDASLEFGVGSTIHIDSRFDNCTITLGEGAELTIGESGVLKNCAIEGRGKLIVHGRFFERQSPGIAGVQSLYVSARGGIVGGIEQATEGTSFAFEPGCRLRMKIVNPRLPQAAE